MVTGKVMKFCKTWSVVTLLLMFFTLFNVAKYGSVTECMYSVYMQDGTVHLYWLVHYGWSNRFILSECLSLAVSYQLEMMKNLRHVNIDHLHVGWYQSTNFGTYINKALVDSQFNYQFSIDESIVLIYGQSKLADLSFTQLILCLHICWHKMFYFKKFLCCYCCYGA